MVWRKKVQTVISRCGLHERSGPNISDRMSSSSTDTSALVGFTFASTFALGLLLLKTVQRRSVSRAVRARAFEVMLAGEKLHSTREEATNFRCTPACRGVTPQTNTSQAQGLLRYFVTLTRATIEGIPLFG